MKRTVGIHTAQRLCAGWMCAFCRIDWNAAQVSTVTRSIHVTPLHLPVLPIGLRSTDCGRIAAVFFSSRLLYRASVHDLFDHLSVKGKFSCGPI